MRAPLGSWLGGTKRVVYARVAVGALIAAVGCGDSSAMDATDAGVDDGTLVVDASVGGSADSDEGDLSTRADGDEAGADVVASSDTSLDLRNEPEISNDSGVADGASSDIRVSRDAMWSDGALDDVVSRDDAAPDGRGPPDHGDPPDHDIPDGAGMRCNGYEVLCDRRFDEVVFPTTHNAMSNAADGWVAPNQQHGMKRQLEDGIRGMLIDTHSYMGNAYLCHSSCLLGSKLLVDGLRDVTTFLQNHPHEVLTFVIEDHISALETEAAFTASGLAEFVYVHPPGNPWPTLRTMIMNGRRVLVGAESGAAPPAWYHHFYDLAWDTPYSFRATSEFSCRQNRGNRQNALFLLNHWLENPLPDENLSRTANARDVLLSRARQCQTESGKLPNFVAVNHYAVGDLLAVVRELNGL
jgi:hypothetical protein